MLLEAVVSLIVVFFTINVLIPLASILFTYTIGKKFLSRRSHLKNAGTWAVVTGGCGGIGFGYAHQLAAEGLNLLLLSNDADSLKHARETIQNKYGVEVRTVTVDFTRTDVYKDLQSQIHALPSIACLVNNVGMFYPRGFKFGLGQDMVSLDFCRKLITCNMIAMVSMTRIVLPKLLVQSGRGAAIINLSSLSAMGFIPFAGLYASSKKFILHFSEALRNEISYSSIVVQTVCPHYVVSNMTQLKNGSFSIPDPLTFAKSALDLLGVEHVTCGYHVHAIIKFICRFIPQGVKTSRVKRRLDEWSCL